MFVAELGVCEEFDELIDGTGHKIRLSRYTWVPQGERATKEEGVELEPQYVADAQSDAQNEDKELMGDLVDSDDDESDPVVMDERRFREGK